jgi:hypothetical protein
MMLSIDEGNHVMDARKKGTLPSLPILCLEDLSLSIMGYLR